MAITGNCLILSIRREHAQRIFEGSKLFELRKALPSKSFKRVYLYESGGKGIIGCFDAARVIREKKNVLWDAVNYRATTRKRFDTYFERYADGYAIEVSKPVRFKKSVTAQELREIDPRFHAPMSSLLLRRDSPLGQFLEGQRRLDRKRQPAEVMLMPIAERDRARYEELVLRHVGARYEGIDETFAARTLEVHDAGHDSAGFFTESKQVLSIWHQKRHIGFTTITWKNNGCAKTGPTIIEQKYQNSGFGRATRCAVEALARKAGFRKIYCTCADDAAGIIGYLLDSGMKVEAHLDRQYSGEHGELVFGKFLVADEFDDVSLPVRKNLPGKLIDIRGVDRQKLSRDIAQLFSEGWTPMNEHLAGRIVQSAMSKNKPDPRVKAKRLVCVGSGNIIIGASVLLPKRGGAVKALLATVTSKQEILSLLIEESCRLSCSWNSRKIYFLHPLLDSTVVRALRESQFQMEGFLKAPYRPGEDVGIFSRFC
jgi:predicted transcriptional regulator